MKGTMSDMSSDRRLRKFISASALLTVLSLFVAQPADAQQTNNSSSLTNSAAPSASSTTTGGTNINYQTNNAYQNEVGFGPGIFCRTPTVFLGGNYGENQLDSFDAIAKSGNEATNYSVNAGLVFPFGSPAQRSCNRLASLIVQDREISTQLSMIRACASLQRDGIRVDPELYPLLEKCATNVLGPKPPSPRAAVPPRSVTQPRQQQNLPPKVPQTTRS